jgi:hypothetical protein
MKAIESMVAWTPCDYDGPSAGQVRVGRWPDEMGWSDPFLMTSGACYIDRHKLTAHERRALVFIDFNTLVVRDGIDVQAAHKAFLAIDEYRQFISPDIDGASQ